MARELLAQSVQRTPEQSLSDVHGHVANEVIAELLDRWKSGLQVSSEAFITTTKLVRDGSEDVIGFRMYLVVGEPQPYGPLKVETVTDDELVGG